MTDLAQFEQAQKLILSGAAPGVSAYRVTIGKHTVDAVVSSPQGAVDLCHVLDSLMQKTRRVRARTAGSRYMPPLPVGTAPRLLSIEVNDYLNDASVSGCSPTTIKKYRRILRLLSVVTGDIEVNKITRDHIRAYWDVFRWWPKNAGKKNVLRGLTDDQILEFGKQEGGKPPADSYRNLAWKVLNGFFNKLAEQDAIARSPFVGLPKFKDRAVKTGRALTDQELQKIFDPQTFPQWAVKYPHRWWAPMIALYTGARINEICQLKAADIIEEHGMWCFAFQTTDDEDLAESDGVTTRQQLKCPSSVRTIPIAQPLLDSGFLDFVADINFHKHPRLFPNLNVTFDKGTGQPDGRGYSGAQVTQFGEYLKANTNLEKGIGSHAFRHTIASRLKSTRGGNVDVELIATITGHAPDRRVPTLQLRYIHTDPAELRQLQADALAKYLPPVSLPPYVPGQFLSRLRPGAKVYP